MSASIDVQNDAAYPVDAQRLQDAAAGVLAAQLQSPESALTIVITDDEMVRRLNHRYRDIDAPTDVLSFPAEPPPVAPPDEPPYLGAPYLGAPYLGDLIIAYPYALAQAEQEGLDPGDNLALLVVHGTLHLLGFDHDTPKNRATMWAAQEATLQALGVPTSIVPALEHNPDDAQT